LWKEEQVDKAVAYVMYDLAGGSRKGQY